MLVFLSSCKAKELISGISSLGVGPVEEEGERRANEALSELTLISQIVHTLPAFPPRTCPCECH